MTCFATFNELTVELNSPHGFIENSEFDSFFFCVFQIVKHDFFSLIQVQDICHVHFHLDVVSSIYGKDTYFEVSFVNLEE